MQKMKFRYRLLKSARFASVSFLLALLSSCLKDLDNKYPETQLSDVSFWTTENHLRDAVNYLYTTLPAIGENSNANWSDDGRGTANNNISDGSRLAPPSSGDWDDRYSNIQKANNILEKAAGMDIDPTVAARYTAEARFFRAFNYMELVRRYGDVPLILQTMDVEDEGLAAPRSNRNEIVLTIYADLDEALAHLPSVAELPAAEYGRITIEACLALKARVALFEGTFNKYHGLPNAQQHLEVAVSSTATIMEENYFSLYQHTPSPDSSYYYLFQNEGNEAREEVILPRLYGENPQNAISTHLYSRLLQQGNTTPTRSIMDAYLFIDGLPATGSNRSPLYEEPVNTLGEFENRDPRMGMTVFKRGDYYTTSPYIPSFNFTQTGYKLRKWYSRQDDLNQSGSMHHKIFRYAEVLLTFAEALFELNGHISDAELNRSVNLIRDRVNMPPLTNAFVGAHGLNMLEEIRRERRVELAFEGGHRYWDIIRWKVAEEVLPQAARGIQYFPEEYGSGTGIDNPNLDDQGFIIAQQAQQRVFNAEKDYLWPIPVQQLGLNPNLVQNPNWR